MQSEEKKLSFGFSFADEKIKLIDILTENDDFLVDSPFCASDSFSDSNIGFRVSGFRNSPELKMLQQNDHKQFHRKSLAWDSRFFDSPGVLDPDELSCLNTGIKTTEARLQKRISELKSRPNDDAGFSADWFEIKPSLYKPKSKKTSKISLLTRKKVNQSFRNDSTVIRRQGPILSPKLPKALGRNISTISNNSRNLTSQVLFTKKKSALQSWSSLNNNSGSSAQTPSLLKRKTESRESRLQNKNISQKALSSSVDIKKQRSNIHLDVMKSFRGALDGNDKNEASRLQSPLNTPKQYSRICSVGSLSANSFKPSELRPPSPQIGFFDENTCPRYHDTARNRSENALSPDTNKASRHSWARKELKGTCSEVANKNTKRPKTGHTNSSSSVTDQENRAKKNLPSSDVDQLGTLSSFFAAIDLKEEKLTQLKKRAPLADKTSSFNSGRIFRNFN